MTNGATIIGVYQHQRRWYFICNEDVGDGGDEVGEFLPRPEAGVVLGGVEDDQMAAGLQAVMDIQRELAAGGEVVVLDDNFVVGAGQDVRDFPRRVRDRSAAADEVVMREVWFIAGHRFSNAPVAVGVQPGTVTAVRRRSTRGRPDQVRSGVGEAIAGAASRPI